MKVTKVYMPKAIRERGYAYTRRSKSDIKMVLDGARPNTMVSIEEVSVNGDGNIGRDGGQVITLKASLIQALEEIDEASAVNDLIV